MKKFFGQPLVVWSLFTVTVLTAFLACRTLDLVTGAYVPPASELAANAQPPESETRTPTEPRPTREALATQEPTEFIPIEEPTQPPAPTDLPAPTEFPTEPPPTRPTIQPPPRATATPEPPAATPAPTRCPHVYCVQAASCMPGENTRAIGTVYANGSPENGLTVRVSNAYKGSAIAADFVSGHDPINTAVLDPLHPGYYQVGIVEGSPRAGNWWVFLLNERGEVVSEGRVFNTQDVQTADSCQIGITDFSK